MCYCQLFNLGGGSKFSDGGWWLVEASLFSDEPERRGNKIPGILVWGTCSVTCFVRRQPASCCSVINVVRAPALGGATSWTAGPELRVRSTDLTPSLAKSVGTTWAPPQYTTTGRWSAHDRTSQSGWPGSGPSDGPTSMEESSGRSVSERAPTSASVTVMEASVPTGNTSKTAGIPLETGKLSLSRRTTAAEGGTRPRVVLCCSVPHPRPARGLWGGPSVLR